MLAFTWLTPRTDFEVLSRSTVAPRSSGCAGVPLSCEPESAPMGRGSSSTGAGKVTPVKQTKKNDSARRAITVGTDSSGIEGPCIALAQSRIPHKLKFSCELVDGPKNGVASGGVDDWAGLAMNLEMGLAIGPSRRGAGQRSTTPASLTFRGGEDSDASAEGGKRRPLRTSQGAPPLFQGPALCDDNFGGSSAPGKVRDAGIVDLSPASHCVQRFG